VLTPDAMLTATCSLMQNLPDLDRYLEKAEGFRQP
jgi:hypothetical protein